MAKMSGKGAIITLDDSAGAPQIISADVVSYTIEYKVNAEDVTGFGEGSQNFVPGMRVVGVTLDVNWNTAATTGAWTVIRGIIGHATSKTLVVQPEGTGLALTGEYMCEGVSPSGAAAGSPIKSLAYLKGKKIGMSPPGSATHAILGAVLEGTYGLKASDYSVVPGNEGRLWQFIAQKEVDAASIRSVTLAQMSDEVKFSTIANVVDEWKKLTKNSALPILAVTIVHQDYLSKQPEAVAKFIAATRKALEYGAKNKDKVAEILQKTANMSAEDAKAYAGQWNSAYMASFEAADVASLKRMHAIRKAMGAVKIDPPDTTFVTEPFQKSKQIK
jgi:ABC-type nitrate/sulfonate/bicarbonate transport system substrate-binding protein